MASEYVTLPAGAGQPISMCVYQDRLYVAFEFGVYRYTAAKSGAYAEPAKWEQILAIAQPKDCGQ